MQQPNDEAVPITSSTQTRKRSDLSRPSANQSLQAGGKRASGDERAPERSAQAQQREQNPAISRSAWSAPPLSSTRLSAWPPLA